jgi:protein KTI12
MPLLLMCGHPSSGKTSHAKTLSAALTSRGARVHVVNEESLGQVRSLVYDNPAAEKIARGELKATVERLMSNDDVVIADSCNYIKGFRYELHCGLRLAGSTHAVVHCAADVATCVNWDMQRAASGFDSWGERLLRDYAARFEAPNDRQRWYVPPLPALLFRNI